MGISSSYSNDARRQAAHILSQPPFVQTSQHIPDPLAGVLHAIGRAFDDTVGKVFGWIGRHISSAAHDVFGPFAWVAIIVVALAIGVLAGLWLIRRRTRIGRRQTDTALEAITGENVAELEAAARAAEQRGDLEEAVRLRFRAGLARLEAAGVIASRLVTTTDQARRTLRNPTFDRLASRHEAIAYASEKASPEDAGAARDGWPHVIDEATSSKASAR